MTGRGRGRLSSFDTMPPEADPIIAWVAQELASRDRTQTDIYAEFTARCEELMKEHRGELEFRIPAFSSFNRYSLRQARLTRRLDQTREIVSAIAGGFDAKDADDLTIMTAETIKALVLHMLADQDDAVLPKDVMHMASALRQASHAQSVSAENRRKREAEVAKRVSEAVDAAAKAKGMTAETAEAIKAQILGVTLTKEDS